MNILAYHNDPKIKAKYLRRVRAHAKADQIVGVEVIESLLARNRHSSIVFRLTTARSTRRAIPASTAEPSLVLQRAAEHRAIHRSDVS